MKKLIALTFTFAFALVALASSASAQSKATFTGKWEGKISGTRPDGSTRARSLMTASNVQSAVTSSVEPSAHVAYTFSG